MPLYEYTCNECETMLRGPATDRRGFRGARVPGMRLARYRQAVLDLRQLVRYRKLVILQRRLRAGLAAAGVVAVFT